MKKHGTNGKTFVKNGETNIHVCNIGGCPEAISSPYCELICPKADECLTYIMALDVMRVARQQQKTN